jgi:hypothetical protein
LRNYRGSRAAIFTSPLSPAFDLFLYQAPLFSISSLCLYYFRLYEALRFRARTRRSAKGHTAQTGTAEHCWPQAHSWAKPQPPHSAQQPCTLGPQTVYKIQINGRIFESLVSGNRPCADSLVSRLGLWISWRGVVDEGIHHRAMGISRAGADTSRKTDLLDLFIRMSYFDHKSNIKTKTKRMKGPQVSRQRYRAAL